MFTLFDEYEPIDSRPFDFTTFVLLPIQKLETVSHHENDCRMIEPGTNGVVQTDYADSDSRHHVFHKTESGEMLAVGYESLAGYIEASFTDRERAVRFLIHLKGCILARAPEWVFEKSAREQAEREDGSEDESEDYTFERWDS